MTILSASELNNRAYYVKIIKENKWTGDEWIMFNMINRLCRESSDKGFYEHIFGMNEFANYYKYVELFKKFGYRVEIDNYNNTFKIRWD